MCWCGSGQCGSVFLLLNETSYLIEAGTNDGMNLGLFLAT